MAKMQESEPTISEVLADLATGGYSAAIMSGDDKELKKIAKSKSNGNKGMADHLFHALQGMRKSMKGNYQENTKKKNRKLKESIVYDYVNNPQGLTERMNTFFQQWCEYLQGVEPDGWDGEGYSDELYYWVRTIGLDRDDYDMVIDYITERGLYGEDDPNYDFDEYSWAMKYCNEEWVGDETEDNLMENKKMKEGATDNPFEKLMEEIPGWEQKGGYFWWFDQPDGGVGLNFTYDGLFFLAAHKCPFGRKLCKDLGFKMADGCAEYVITNNGREIPNANYVDLAIRMATKISELYGGMSESYDPDFDDAGSDNYVAAAKAAKKMDCPACGGKAFLKTKMYGDQPCPYCGGTGQINKEDLEDTLQWMRDNDGYIEDSKGNPMKLAQPLVNYREEKMEEDFEDLEDNPNVLKFKKDPDDVAEELEPIIDSVFDDGGMTEGLLDVICWKPQQDADGADYECVITLTAGALETQDDLNIAIEEVLVDRLDELGYDMSFDYVEDSKTYEDAMDIGIRLWVQ